MSEKYVPQLDEAYVKNGKIIETGEEKKEFAGYRLYTKIGMNNGFVIVGVEVKSMGMNMEVNSIRTVFSRRRRGELEEEIYIDPEITQEQSEFLVKGGDYGAKKQHPSNRHF